MEEIILANNYIKEGYGYKRKGIECIHWITLFKSGNIQMYAYLKNDETFNKIYDTGVIDITTEQLQILIDIVINNHN